MTPDLTALERRLAVLEAAVAELQRRLSPALPAPDWLEQISGIAKDEPDFEKVLEYGREYRYADLPPEEPEEPTP